MGEGISFKPYYNWNTFNTPPYGPYTSLELSSFKPYYNWNTFNTEYGIMFFNDFER